MSLSVNDKGENKKTEKRKPMISIASLMKSLPGTIKSYQVYDQKNQQLKNKS
ncbi:hypothetical protein HZU77_010430 [Neisseriaceae bacterium TC5R-5]|nr:hypothetical protein [Neisseriaceae bacterium TC5R-5]